MRFIKCFSLDTFVITIAIIIIVFPVSACRLPVSEDLAENKCSPSTYCLLTKYANDTSGKKGSNVCSTKIHLWVDLMILYLFFPCPRKQSEEELWLFCGHFTYVCRWSWRSFTYIFVYARSRTKYGQICLTYRYVCGGHVSSSHLHISTQSVSSWCHDLFFASWPLQILYFESYSQSDYPRSTVILKGCQVQFKQKRNGWKMWIAKSQNENFPTGAPGSKE